jgi:predicted CxxxxCH...CXXCH cytochrome family protein
VLDLTGAPPADIDGEADPALITFPGHNAHVTEGISSARDCTTCHDKPTDVTTSGHLFDATAGIAEVDLTGGLSAVGNYDLAGGCSNTYCHGDGQGDNGAWSQSDGSPGCDDCHYYLASSETQWNQMSGRHKKHLGKGHGCNECHVLTDDDANGILDPTIHVDGFPDVAFIAPIAYSAGKCSGECHQKNHQNRNW